MAGRLSLLIWPDYVSPATLTEFERQTGIGIDLEIVPSAVEIVDRMRMTVRHPDVLTPPSYAVLELEAEGRLAQLDHSRLPNLRHIERRFLRGRPHDPESRVSLIKDWGTTGFMYRIDKVRELPASWADFWSLAEKYSGHVTVLDSPGEVIGAALKMRGCPYNSTNPDDLAVARLDLLRLKPHLLRFETNYRPLLSSGEAWLSLGWNGDAAALIADGVPVWYVIPAEGSQIWEDDWAIAADTENVEAAHAFLDFVIRPDIAAQEALYTRYATGNRSAHDLLAEDVRNDSSTYPPAGLIEKLEAGMPLDARGRHRRKVLWDELRNAG
jgi:spermidine/putrescine transport system substrate-binding protein